jgi:hypothetical protein
LQAAMNSGSYQPDYLSYSFQLVTSICTRFCANVV